MSLYRPTARPLGHPAVPRRPPQPPKPLSRSEGDASRQIDEHPQKELPERMLYYSILLYIISYYCIVY